MLTGPVVLRGRTAPSRVLFGPHETNLARRRDLSDRHVAYYAERAAGGAGVIVTEIASVDRADHPYARAPLAADAAAGWVATLAACRPHGTLVVAGLGHAGGQGCTAHTPGPLWGPSPVLDVVSREVPAELDGAGIDAIVDGFGAAATRAANAGLDGVEVNAGQHSLLRQFLSGLTNHRLDGYGTDRSRLLREVLAAVRAGLGDDRVLGLRLCCDELAPWAGITPASAAAVVAEVADDVDYVVPVRGSGLSVAATRPDLHTPPGAGVALSTAVRSVVDGRCAVVLQGGVVDAAVAQAAVADGVADLVEMTRAQIADPRLVAHLRAGTPERIRPCTLTNRWMPGRDPRNPLVSDDAEPRSGHETEDPPVDAVPGTAGLDVLVVGGGPAGLEAARTAALRGHRVRLTERAPQLGGALRLAAALPGRARIGLLVDWWERELDRLGVTVATGCETGLDDLDAARRAGTAVVLATGSRPAEPGFAVGPGVRVVAAAEFVATERIETVVPGSVAPGSVAGAFVAGPDVAVVVHDPVGDEIGTGVAELVAAAGRRCVLVTPDPVAGAGLPDPAAANGRLLRAGIERALHARARSAGAGQVELVDVHTGAVRTVACTLVVDCAHRLPDDTLWAARPGLARAGDCVAPRTMHEAVREGRRAVLAVEGSAPAPPGRSVSLSAGHVATDESTPLLVPAATAPGATGRTGSVAAQSTGSPRTSAPPPPGPDDPDPLFTPLQVGPLRLRNRIVFAAHLTGFALDGLPTGRHAAYYAARAAGGAGLVITEEHAVHPGDHSYEHMIRGHDPAVLDGYGAITAAVHAHGVPVLAQLNHNGPQSSGLYSRAPVWAPSAVADPMFREVPVAMTTAQIDELVAAYADVARRCVAGGFDGVELQCSQASILRAFLAPATNRRIDGYGGSLRRRARMLLEVVAAVRGALGPGAALGVRLGGGEGVDGGVEIADAVEVARWLAATGHVDYLSTSTGLATATLHLVEAPTPVPAGYQSALPAAVRRAVAPLPVLGAGRFTDPGQARRALDEGVCDLVGVVRGQIADPDFVARSRIADPGGPGRPRACVGCNQECTGRVGLNRPLRCTVNPRAGREGQPVRAPRWRRRVLVVGAGPAGLRAAATAADRGHRVTLVERGPTVGGRLALAATAPGRGELQRAVDDLLDACARAGVEIRTGTDADPELVLRVGADEVVLATGARPVLPPWASGLRAVGDVVDVLGGRFAPTGSVLVYDELGFHEATSVAELLAARGTQVQILTPGMVVGQDLGLTLNLPGFRRRARAAGITSATDRVVTAAAARDGRIALTVLHHPTGALAEQQCDAVVCAVAPRPADELWRALRGTGVVVHRIGDCLAPRRADAAVAEGDRVGELIGTLNAGIAAGHPGS